MAHIGTGDQDQILKLQQFLGLNEDPDGDTVLKVGELSECRNFKITRDHHLQIRPGQRKTADLRSAWDALAVKPAGVAVPKLCGVWRGAVGGAEHTVASFGGALFDVDLTGDAAPREIGRCTQDAASFFGFGNKVYLLNGHEYMGWDGGSASSFEVVEGYVPTTYTARPPAGGGTMLEKVDRLTGKRRVQFSPDGTATAFLLPEAEIDEVCSVEGTSLSYTVDKAKGTVTFASAPPAGTNTVSIVYRKGDGSREDVERMRFAEFYNGNTDTRVFLYGDGTERTIFSGNELAGGPSAEYFPDLDEARVGDANTPITAMIRHHARLLVFKTGSAWSMDYQLTTSALNVPVVTFAVQPVNRRIGHGSPGQARLLENDPLTLAEGSVYQWRPTSTSGNVIADARNAVRISDRVRDTLSRMDLARAVTFDRLSESEYWILQGGRALIYGYGADAWYLYDGMPFTAMVEADREIYGFTEDGEVRHVSRAYRNDCGADIEAYAATGSMDFGRDWQRKYSPKLYVAIKPEGGARVYVTVETNRRSDYVRKIVSAGLAQFSHVDFGHFSFGTNRKPQVRRVKLKVKKAVFYKLIYESDSASATATVLETDIQLRYTGNVK